MTAPVLVFGWGNLSRGDDALGPMFVRELSALAGSDVGRRVELLEDYQLQIEHALDLVARQRVLFVDASVSCVAPFEVTTLSAACGAMFTTHALSPASVMRVYCDLYSIAPPPCTLLAIRGMHFALGEPPGPLALTNLALAVAWGHRWLESDATT